MDRETRSSEVSVPSLGARPAHGGGTPGSPNSGFRSKVFPQMKPPIGSCAFLLSLLLAPASVLADYRSEVLADEPVAYWRLGDAGPGAADETGNGHDGFATDMVTFGEGSLVLPDEDPAASFAGQGQIVTAPFEKMDGGGFSVEFWVKFAATPSGFVNLVGDGEDGGDFMLMVYAGPGGFIRAHAQTTDGIVAADSTLRLADGGVHHVVSTWDSNTGALVLYINGESHVTNTTTGAAVNSDNPIFIGRDNREPTPPATIDEVAIYPFPLDPARVAAHFAEVEIPDIIDPIDPVGTGVRVGESALIGTLHYSDTFTIGPDAETPERQGYVAQTFPLPDGVGAVEDTYGNPLRSWGDGAESMWSIATDDSNLPTGGSPYLAPSGAGSDTGFTQRGGGGDWAIEYGLSDHFVFQTDYVQQIDRVDMTVGTVPGDIFGAGNISVFFRVTNHPQHPEIGIFNAGVGESDTGFESTIAAVATWNNYALRVDIPNDQIEVYVNEASVGIIDLATLNGGTYAGILSNEFIGVGGAGNDRQWSDNFQVGLPGSASPRLFAITDFSYDPDTSEVSLTWNSLPARTYKIEGSIGLTTWFELFDAVPSGGSSTQSPTPFNLDSIFGGNAPPQLHIRIVEAGAP
ncbi:hypothetical protein BH23VER1_BH23VER1_33050 [soil metagenome]